MHIFLVKDDLVLILFLDTYYMHGLVLLVLNMNYDHVN
jgi:hypothetical protein